MLYSRPDEEVCKGGPLSDIPITDIHTHFGASPASDLDVSLDCLLGLLWRHGVRQALTYSLAAVQFDSAAGNDETWQAHQDHAELYPVAVVDARAYPGGEAEVARRAEQGFVGFRFFPQRQGWALDSLPFQRLLRAVEQTGKPAIVSVAGAGEATRLFRIAGRLTTPVVLYGVSYATLGEALAVVGEAENLYLEAHIVTQPFQVEAMIEAVGVRKLLFGSMAPTHYLRPSLAVIENAEIAPADKALILGGNARRLFGLPEVEVHA